MAEKKPFHVTVIGLIQRARTVEELVSIGQLLLETVIPKDHDKILSSWRARGQLLGVFSHLRDADPLDDPVGQMLNAACQQRGELLVAGGTVPTASDHAAATDLARDCH